MSLNSNKKSLNHNVKNTVFAAMFLGIALVLPLLTGQIREIGSMLCPMHIPVLLCGFFCGPWYALLIGLIAPVLRFFIFGMPPLFPVGIPMCFELAAYGFFAGFLYLKLPAKRISIYAALIAAMLLGRVAWGIASAVAYGVTDAEFGTEAFIAGAFVNAIPGIIVQIILIPVLVMSLRKFTANSEKH